MPERTRTHLVGEIPAITRYKISAAIRRYYEGCELVDGPALQVLVLHSEVDDPQPLCGLLIVLPENKITADWIESVNSEAAHSWDTLIEWAKLEAKARNASGR